jgi:hypothetical protein
MPFIRVAGITGSGDPFCDPEKTLTTLDLYRHPMSVWLSVKSISVMLAIKQELDV